MYFLIKPPTLVPREDLECANLVDQLGHSMPGLTDGLAGDGIVDFLILDFADRESFLRGLAFAAFDFSVTGIRRHFQAAIFAPGQMIKVVEFSLMQQSLPFMAKRSECRRCPLKTSELRRSKKLGGVNLRLAGRCIGGRLLY